MPRQDVTPSSSFKLPIRSIGWRMEHKILSPRHNTLRRWKYCWFHCFWKANSKISIIMSKSLPSSDVGNAKSSSPSVATKCLLAWKSMTLSLVKCYCLSCIWVNILFVAIHFVVIYDIRATSLIHIVISCTNKRQELHFSSERSGEARERATFKR